MSIKLSKMPEVLQTKEKPVGTEEVLSVLQRFQEIEEKNRCLRVRFLDALSIKLHAWGDKVKAMANNIDSPCVIKLKEKK